MVEGYLLTLNLPKATLHGGSPTSSVGTGRLHRPSAYLRKTLCALHGRIGGSDQTLSILSESLPETGRR